MPLLLLLLLALLPCTSAKTMADGPSVYGDIVDESGTISLPENYRIRWSHLGSWLVDDPEAPGHGLHDVYTQPASVAHFLETGSFPDGAVLVKEVRAVRAGAKTTGPAQWAGDIKLWFVMVKDTRGRFEGNANWSNGWGWALFEGNEPRKNVSEGFATSCRGCHTPARDRDWVFTEGYPTLLADQRGGPQ